MRFAAANEFERLAVHTDSYKSSEVVKSQVLFFIFCFLLYHLLFNFLLFFYSLFFIFLFFYFFIFLFSFILYLYLNLHDWRDIKIYIFYHLKNFSLRKKL